MTIQIRKAERRKAKLRLGVAAPSGGGKTYGALQLAFGMGGKVGVVDSEHGSADLYADLGEYDVIQIKPPYTVAKYMEAVHAFEEAQYTTIIIDSLSHAWAGEGGLLDKQGQMADKGGNSYTAWRKITPEHNNLVDAMLKSPCHIIATMRSKQEYVQDKDEKGKTVIRKVGMAPVQREGMEYEFTVMLDVDGEHNATASKDRTSMFDGRIFKLSKQIGKELMKWLETGKEAVVEKPAEPEPVLATPGVSTTKHEPKKAKAKTPTPLDDEIPDFGLPPVVLEPKDNTPLALSIAESIKITEDDDHLKQILAANQNNLNLLASGSAKDKKLYGRLMLTVDAQKAKFKQPEKEAL